MIRGANISVEKPSISRLHYRQSEDLIKLKELLTLVASRHLKNFVLDFTDKHFSIFKGVEFYEYFKTSQTIKTDGKLVIICTELELEENVGDTLILKEWKNQDVLEDYGDVYKISDSENENLKKIKLYLLATELSKFLENDRFETKLLQYSREFLLSSVFEKSSIKFRGDFVNFETDFGKYFQNIFMDKIVLKSLSDSNKIQKFADKESEIDSQIKNFVGNLLILTNLRKTGLEAQTKSELLVSCDPKIPIENLI